MLENIAEPHRPPYFAPFCARHANTHCPTGRAEALSDTYFYSTADMVFPRNFIYAYIDVRTSLTDHCITKHRAKHVQKHPPTCGPSSVAHYAEND